MSTLSPLAPERLFTIDTAEAAAEQGQSPSVKALIAREKMLRRLPDKNQHGDSLRQHISNVQMDFLPWWSGEYQKFHPQEEAIIKRELAKLKGQIVIDLGCGPYFEKTVEWLSQYQPEGYIGVDIYADENTFNRPIAGTIVRGDMLDIVSKLPSDSFSVLLNGIDEGILPNQDYRKALTDGISRIASTNGIVFGVTLAAGPLQELSETGQFEISKIAVNHISENDRKNFYFLSKHAKA